jgi:molybdopterin molybdotransferase
VIPLGEARERVLARCTPLPVERVPIAEAVGLVVAEAVTATEHVPPFANTAMDGYAVVAADTVGARDDTPVTLEVVGAVAAGSDGQVPMGPGQAVRIMTGAPIPPGADAVVMVERCRPDRSGQRVDILVEVPVGNHVRRPGEDLAPGDVVVEPGTALRAGHLGVLAGLGVEEVAVHRRPRVAVFSTGDELVEGPAPLAPGQIRDSNRHTLVALLRELGCEARDLGIVPDDEACCPPGCPTACGAPRTARPTSYGSGSPSTTTGPSSPARRAGRGPTSSRRWRRPTGSRCSPTATGWTQGAAYRSSSSPSWPPTRPSDRVGGGTP